MSDIFQGGNDPAVLEVKFDEIVGEGKKFATADDVAKAIAHKDAFIEQLKREAQEAREAVQKRINEEEFLTRMETLSRGTPPVVENQPQPDTGAQPTAVTLDDIDKRLEAREAERQKQANLKAVVDKLQATLGEGYKTHIQRQAQSLGLTTEYLTSVAANSPQAFFRLTGLDQQQERRPNDMAPPRSLSVPSIQGQGPKKYKDYLALRQQKGDGWYFTQAVQREIWTAAKAQGEDFYS